MSRAERGARFAGYGKGVVIKMGEEWLNTSLVDETIELILVFSESGEILFGNKTAADKLEYTGEELTACKMQQIFRQDFVSMADFDSDRLAGKKNTAMYRKNSSCFPVNIRILPGREEGTHILLAEDITGLRDIETRIRQVREEEEQNLKARNEFTANVTHELRTPVNGIKGHVTELLKDVQDQGQRKTLEIVLFCCDNMLSIINNILDFAKLETGKFTIEEKEFDFYQMMDKVAATHSVEVNKKELRLRVRVDETIPRVVIGDELRLVQILNNLLSNAIKFTLLGSVDVAVSRTMQLNDEVELFFMVKDSGIGMSQKEQDKLFQSFTQADASITRRFGGTGLGLAITKQLVELMQGSIHVESEKGKGSTFSFSVKLRTPQNADEMNGEIYKSWDDFTREENQKFEEGAFEDEEEDTQAELKKRMDKLVLSMEMGAWEKAEMLASTIKAMLEQDEDMKKKVFRMEMAIRKSDYEKSMERYQDLKNALEEKEQ